MPRDVTACVAQIGMPARSGVAAILEIGRIEPEPGQKQKRERARERSSLQD